MENLKILIVEDEQIVAMDVESQLVEIGHQITGIASTGEEALQLIEQTLPDLVLMDIQLYGPMDGVTVAGEIRERWQIPVIFVTAYANTALVTRAKEAGPYGYLTKPYTSKELNAAIAIAVQQHHMVSDLFAEQGWLRNMLSGMSDGVIATDIAGRVKYINPAAEQLSGWTLSEASGLPIETVYTLEAKDGSRLEMCQLRRVLVSGQAIGKQRFLLTKRDGGRIVVEDSAAPIHDSNGQLAGAVAIALDVTERQRMEQERDYLVLELERSNSDFERFAYAIAHDLQNPIHTVKVFVALLTRNLQAQISPDNQELLTLTNQAANSMEQLIKSLLEYATAGRGLLKREAAPLSELVAAVQTDLAGIIAETDTEIVCGILPTLSVDATQLKQVLQNLIVNSIRYRKPEEPPRISILGETTDEGWLISVSDNGQGISPQHRESIFELLTRLHGSNIPGSGIGLALCRTIVERHGGRIWVESSRMGEGTVFCFTLAATQKPAASSETGSSSLQLAQKASR